MFSLLTVTGPRPLQRTRAWTLHPSHPLDSRLSGPEGNPFSRAFVNLGCPVYSAGPILHTELLLVAAHASVARWQTQVHAVEDYQNPEEAVVVDEEELQAANGEADQHPWPEALAVEKAREAERAEQARKKEEERKKAGEEKRQAEEEAKKKKAAEQQEKAEEERLRTGREREKAKEEAAGRVKEEKKKARLEKQRAELAAKPAAGDAAGAAAATPGTGTSRPDLETGGTGSAVRSTGATEQRGGRADEDDDGDAEEGEDFDPLAGHEELKATLAGAMDALQRTVMRAFADRPRVLPYQDEDGDEDEDEDAQERAGEDERDVGC